MVTTTMKAMAKRALGWIAAAVGIAAAAPAAASTITYYHNDIAGSPVAATNSARQVIWRESYRPYGERLTKSASAKSNDVWFTSRREDSSGLVYMGARHYDPVAGRFMSTDPKGFDEANVQSFNRYSYANNNPFRFTDRDGRAPTPIDVGFLLYDAGKLGYEWLSGGDVKGAAIDVGISAAAILVPIPGAALAIKAERGLEAARGAEEVGRGLAESAKGEKEWGSYTNYHESGAQYHGKGSRARSQESAREKEEKYGDPHIATDWTRASSEADAFRDEARRIRDGGGVGSGNYNKINSPGKKYLDD